MATRESQPSDREALDKLVAAGNFKDAYEGYRRLLLDKKTESDRLAKDLTQAARCLRKLGRLSELDAFLEAAVAAHQGNWRLLQAAAETYLFSNEHWGAIIAGRFHRGERQNGQVAGSYSAIGSAPCSSCSRDSMPPDLTPTGLPRHATSLRSHGASWATETRATRGGSRASHPWTSCPTMRTIRPGTITSPAPAHGRGRRHARLLPRPGKLEGRQERRPALAVGTGAGRGNASEPSERQPHHAGNVPARPVRYSNDRRPRRGQLI